MADRKSPEDPSVGFYAEIPNALAFTMEAGKLASIKRADVSPANRGATSLASRREDILDAAERLIRRFGHTKTSMEDIAKAIGTSRANVYRFFPTKDAVEEGVCARIGTAALQSAFMAIRPEDSASQQLSVALMTLGEHAASRMMTETQMHRMFAAGFQRKGGAADSYLRAVLSLIESVILLGVASGEFRPTDSRQTSRFVLTSMLTFIHPGLLEKPGFHGTGTLTTMAEQVKCIVFFLGTPGRKP